LTAILGGLLIVGFGSAEPTNFPKAAKDKYNQAQELMKQQRYKEAIDAYEEAIKLGMNDFPRAHLNKARSMLEMQNYDQAITYYSNFLIQFGLEDSCRT
jgi:tetratricopeptide (TPR) repeat protein